MITEAPPGEAITLEIPAEHLNGKAELGIEWYYRLGKPESIRTFVHGFLERVLGQRSSFPDYQKYGIGLEVVPIPAASGQSTNQ